MSARRRRPGQLPGRRGHPAIVDAAIAKADVLGAVSSARSQARSTRAKLAGGAENRGGESTLGNLVAEVQRWATDAGGGRPRSRS